MQIFEVSRKTIYNWFTLWKDEGILGLYNNQGRGRKPKFKLEQKEEIKQWVKSEPKALNKVMIKIEKKWKIKVSKETIKRILKSLSMISCPLEYLHFVSPLTPRSTKAKHRLASPIQQKAQHHPQILLIFYPVFAPANI